MKTTLTLYDPLITLLNLFRISTKCNVLVEILFVNLGVYMKKKTSIFG